MYEEVLPCEYSNCDVYLLKPGKAQCSYEGTEQCGAEAEYLTRNIMDKTKIAKMDVEAFRQMKELEDKLKQLETQLNEYNTRLFAAEFERDKWKKIADDWRKVAIALATDAGNPDMAIDCYEDIRDGLYDTVRERMHVSPSTKQQAFDGIHDYAILISTKAGEAQELRVAAEDASDTENTYYWEGYEAALDYAIDSLPNYNN
jgi:hypothetical protein